MTNATIAHIDNAPREHWAKGAAQAIMWTLIHHEHLYIEYRDRRKELDRAIAALSRKGLVTMLELDTGGISATLTEAGMDDWHAPATDD